MQEESLVVPITFCCSLSNEEALRAKSSSIADGFSKSRPTALTTWSLDTEDSGSRWGAAMASQDGTAYIFAASLPSNAPMAPTVNVSTASETIIRPTPRRSTSPTKLYPTSPSPSPSIASRSSYGHVPFAITPRTRIVSTSALSKEKVEAPKVFVDYNDEPEKLKDMLKGRGAVRERGLADLIPSFDRERVDLDKPTQEQPTPEKEGVKPVISIPSSPVTSATSRPNSPLSAGQPSFMLPPTLSYLPTRANPSLALKAHLFPPRFGESHTITALKAVERGNLLAGLQQSGAIFICSTTDGMCIASIRLDEPPRLAPPVGCKGGAGILAGLWAWNGLHVASMDEFTFLVAVASDPSIPISLGSKDDDTRHRTRVCVLQLRKSDGDDVGSTDDLLEKIGEWILDCPLGSIGLSVAATGVPSIHYIDSDELIQRTISLASALPPQPSSEPHEPAGSGIHLPLPNLQNPFKSRKARPISIAELREETESRVLLGDEVVWSTFSLGQSVVGAKVWEDQVAVWSSSALWMFSRAAGLRVVIEAVEVQDVAQIEPDLYLILNKECARLYSIRATDKNNDLTSPAVSETVWRSECTSSIPLASSEIACCTSLNGILSTRVDSEGRRCLEHVSLEKIKGKPKLLTVWTTPEPSSKQPLITSLLPLEINTIVVGYSDGHIGKTNFPELMSRSELSSIRRSEQGFDGSVISLHLVKNERTFQRYVVAGVDDGSIGVWDLLSFRLLARWTVFAMPLLTVVNPANENVGRCKGCMLCVSQDGTIAVIAIDGLEFLYLIPGSPALLERVCLGENNVLLLYCNARARLWDMKTQEFWRSMSKDTAEDLLEQGGWFEATIEHDGTRSTNNLFASLQRAFACDDAAATLLLDIRTLIDISLASLTPSAAQSVPEAGTTPDAHGDTTAIPDQWRVLASVLAALFTFGLDKNVDEVCKNKLKVIPPRVPISIGLPGVHASTTTFHLSNPYEAWQISPSCTANRLVALIAVVCACKAFHALETPVSEVVTFYTSSIADSVGAGYQPPSITTLVRYWFNSSPEIKQAARTLFDALVAKLTDQEIIELVEHWRHKLPCLQPDAQKESPSSAMSLIIAGNIAVEKYSLLTPGTLTDIAKSVAHYLHDEESAFRILAIELCSKGFSIWQHYVDAMEVLRALFQLATNTNGAGKTTSAQARLAVLQIAALNTPLFMTTLSLDILNPKTMEHRRAIMQLVAFLIRKKPLVLYPNLPRLVEAVVKSLDPNSSSGRDAVLDAATEILGQVVRTFPTVDFHMNSQRLAVATGEGAVIMYDLKTATRLFVLEGHKKRLAACSFSPDGRRLVTVSLEESVAMVWKVGSSFSSIFNPGGPPRQGQSGSKPFKTYSFVVADEGISNTGTTMDLVGFEWVSDRSVRVKIKDNTLTFST